MPRINIYEHSETYSFQTKNKSYACVAFPITAIWGPAYNAADLDENPDWIRFGAGYRGATDFVNTFRGANTMLGSREKSYDYALKLLSSGYDILVKRADGLGSLASKNLIFNLGTDSKVSEATFSMDGLSMKVTAKEPGSFSNRIKIWLDRTSERDEGSETVGTRVSATLRVYLAGAGQSGLDCMTIKSDDTLLESINITYTQKPKASGSWVTDVIEVNSSYISKLELTGFSNSMSEISDFGNSKYRLWILTLGQTVTGSSSEITGGVEWSQTGTPGSGDESFGQLALQAKYPGSFGNQLKVRIKVNTDDYGRSIGTVEVFNRNGYTGNDNTIVRTDELLELVSVAFNINSASDSRPYITEANFSNLGTVIIQNESLLKTGTYVTSLVGGTDYATVGHGIPDNEELDVQIMKMVSERFDTNESSFILYLRDLIGNSTTSPATPGSATKDRVIQIWNQQKTFQNAILMLSELTDPLLYDWDAVFMGISDDQYIPISWQEAHPEINIEYEVTAAHRKLIEAAGNSKCGAAMIGTPFGMKRGTSNEVTGVKTGAVKFKDDLSSAVGSSLSTFGEVVGPWCRATLPINGANSWITPEVAHLLLIINAEGVGGQNKWWMVPAGMTGTGVVHSPEYKIKKAYLDIIQDHDSGVCLNPLMQVPGKGFTCFGNSTLWNKPLGTYNALQNLSTRFLTNRVKQRIWDTALLILFKYNNENAYSHFYAGVSPLLDEMRAVGALTSTEANPLGYRIIMNPDIINLDRINANTVIGKVELAVTGVIDSVDVDLFLLPPTAFQSEV